MFNNGDLLNAGRCSYDDHMYTNLIHVHTRYHPRDEGAVFATKMVKLSDRTSIGMLFVFLVKQEFDGRSLHT